MKELFEIDDEYMLTVTQTVHNHSNATVRLAPYGIVARKGEPDVQGMFLLHEGVVRSSDGRIQDIDYDDMRVCLAKS